MEIYKTNGVKELLLEKDERLLQDFLPQVIIFRAMMHFNKTIQSKLDSITSNHKTEKNIFDEVDEKLIRFEELSAKENRFEIPISISIFCKTLSGLFT